MKVFFRTMAGNETFSIDADAQMTLSELRNAIGEFVKHDCEIILVLDDRELRPRWDGLSLYNCGVGDGSTLSVIMRTPVQVLTASADGIAKIWNSSTGECIQTFSGHIDGINSVTGRRVSKEVNSAMFSPDGSAVLTASDDHTAKMWNATTGMCIETFLGHTAPVSMALFSPGGTEVLTVSAEDETAQVWSTATGKLMWRLIDPDFELKSAVFTADGSAVLTGSHDRTAKVWSLATGKCTLTLCDYDNWACWLSPLCSPDGSKVFTASARSMCDANIWSAVTGECVHTLRGNGCNKLVRATFSPDGSRVITGYLYMADMAKIWSTATGECIKTLCTGDGWDTDEVVCSPDGSEILAVCRDMDAAKIFNIATGKCRQTLYVCDAHSFMTTAVFSPDGSKLLTASSDHMAKIWNTATGDSMQTLVGHEGRVTSAVFYQAS